MSSKALSRMLLGAGIALPFVILLGCSSSFSPQDEKDLALVGAACQALKESEKQVACVDAAVRLTARKVPDTAIPKMPPPPPPLGRASEEITFKGIPFDQPGHLDKLIGICPNKDAFGDKNECPTVKEVEKRTSDYTDKRPRTSFRVSYGSFNPYRPFHFTFNRDGSLQAVRSGGSVGELLAMIANLSEKYGPPSLQTYENQNGFGAKFESKIAKWVDIRGTQILIESQTEKVGQGRFTIQSGAEIAEEVKEAKLQSDRAKGSL
jgi:hypothetical protein